MSEKQRIEQSNEVAAIVIEQMAKHRPDVFVTMDLRYGIADAVWDAGIRREQSN